MKYIDRGRLAFMRCGQTGYHFGRDFTGGDSQQESTANDNRTVNDLSQGGVQANEGSSISILTSDSNAIRVGGALGERAIAAGDRAIMSGTYLGDQSLTLAQGAVRSVADVTERINRDSLDLTRFALDQSIDFADSNVAQTFGAVRSVLDFAGNSLRTVSGAQQLATESVSQAFTSARDSADGNRTLIVSAYALLGLVALSIFLRKA